MKLALKKSIKNGILIGGNKIMAWDDIKIETPSTKLLQDICDLEYELYGKIISPVNRFTKWTAVNRLKELKKEKLRRK
jgi:hypothetical protein